MPKTVALVTGFPSTMARTIVRSLLTGDDQTEVVLLVRGKIRDTAIAWHAILPDPQRDRVTLLDGDVVHLDFGLSGDEYRGLSRKVTHVYHAAQVTYHGAPRDQALLVNIGGAREVVEFAQACERLKSATAISSALVSGDRTGVVLEDDLKKGQTFRNAVEESLARAELLYRKAMEKSPFVVLRPSVIVGDSQTGEVDRLDGPYLLVLLVLASPPDFAMPLLGRGETPLHVVPVDYVARAAIELSNKPSAIGKTCHLVDPAPVPVRRFFEFVTRAGGRRNPRGSIPANLAKALLRAPGLDRFVKSPRAFLDAMVTPVWYDARNTEQCLLTTQCPPLQEYVERLVAYTQARVQEQRNIKREEGEIEDPLLG